MAEDWPAIASEVAEAIGSVGFTAQIKRTVTGIGPNDWTPGAPVETLTDVTILSDHYSLNEVDGTNILAGDRKIMVEALKIIPAPGDEIIVFSSTYRVMNVKPLDPGGVAVLYEIQARV